MDGQHAASGVKTQSESPASQAQDIGDDYEIPPPEPFTSFAGLKDRIKHHYEICSDYYYSLWYVSLSIEHPRYSFLRLEVFAK